MSLKHRPKVSPGEARCTEVELDSHGCTDCVAVEWFLNSCFLDTVFVTLLCTAVETAVSKVHKLLCAGTVPTSLTSLFRRWLTVSSVFAGRSAWTSYSLRTDPPLSPSIINLMVSEDVEHHERRRAKVVMKERWSLVRDLLS